MEGKGVLMRIATVTTLNSPISEPYQFFGQGRINMGLRPGVSP